jgi:hypothetical protein
LLVGNAGRSHGCPQDCCPKAPSIKPTLHEESRPMFNPNPTLNLFVHKVEFSLEGFTLGVKAKKENNLFV